MRELSRVGLFVFMFGVTAAFGQPQLTVSHLAGAEAPTSVKYDGCPGVFAQPYDVAVDTKGNVYVADTFHYVIRKITPSGRVMTLAGLADNPGDTDGTGDTARFFGPQGVAVDSRGTVYITDTPVRKVKSISPSGVVTTIVALGGDIGPDGITVDANDNVYFTAKHAIYKRTADGTLTVFAGTPNTSGNADGKPGAFFFPSGLTFDGSGNLIVADFSNSSIRKVSPSGVVSSIVSLQALDVAVDSSGNIWISRANKISKLSPAGAVLLEVNFTESGVRGLTIDASDNLFASDTVKNAIRKITPTGGRSTFAGQGTDPQDGDRCSARLISPTSVTVTTDGTIYVSDSRSLRRVTTAGVVTTVPGVVTESAYLAADHSGNAWAVTLSGFLYRITPAGVITQVSNGFVGAAGLAIDSAGNAFVSSKIYHVIWKVTSSSADIFAGHYSVAGSSEGTGTNAYFNMPQGLAIDAADNIYIADSNNHLIRKMTPGGVVVNLAGAAGAAATVDQNGPAARFNFPYAVASDAAGNLIVAQSSNVLRRVTTSADVTTVAGSLGVNGYADGTGTSALLGAPLGVAIDATGRVLIADGSNNALRVGIFASSAGQQVSLSGGSFSGVEDTGSIGVTVNRTAASGAMTVDVTTGAPGTATPVADYVAQTRVIRFDEGETTKAISLPIAPDTIDEVDETFTVQLSNPTGGATVGSTASADATITDDDDPPGIRISDVAVAEGNGPTNAVFRVSLDRLSDRTVTVNYATASGSAMSADDFVPAAGMLTFNPGEFQKFVTVVINGDNVQESDETFFVNLSAASNATIADSQGQGTILDDDGSRTFTFTNASYSVNETGTLVQLTVVRNGPTNTVATVDYATANGTASSGADYAQTSGTLQFDAGQTSKTISVLIFDDAATEGNETFSVVLSNPTGATILGSPSTATVTIVDDDTSQFTFAAPQYLGDPRAYVVTLTVTRTNASSSGSVSYATSDGTAKDPSDYVAATGTLNFNSGETSKTIQITLPDDRIAEPTETFLVTLSNPTGSLGAIPTTTVAIVDDDPFAQSVNESGVLARGDFNGDGKSDIVWRNAITGATFIWYMNGANVVSGSANLIVDPAFRLAAVVDLNGDHKSDMVWYNPNTSTTDIWLMNGTTVLSSHAYISFGAPWDVVGTGDFNHDGTPDILWRNLATGSCLIWYMNGNTVVSGSAYFTVDPSFRVAGIGDLNGDGYADLVWYNGNSGTIDFWLMQGSTRIASRDYLTTSYPWDVVAMGDFNHDGRPDILWRNANTGTTFYWAMNGTTVVSGSASFVVDPSFMLKGTGDFDANGSADLVWYDGFNGIVDVWLMDGITLLGHGSYGMAQPWDIVGPR
jgi:hypothetical protein